jgi:formate dehydrogenase subunit delta
MTLTGPTPPDPELHKVQQREKLARMAGQIADFFKSYPADQAVPAIAEHINHFWSRRMRGDFLAAFSADAQELHPLVRAALARIKPAQGG